MTIEPGDHFTGQVRSCISDRDSYTVRQLQESRSQPLETAIEHLAPRGE